ncbi:MAG: AAA family ATPase [Kiritimatiellia bacterium]
MSTVLEILRDVTRGRHPLVYIKSPEEDRISHALAELAREVYPDGRISAWTCVEGLEGEGPETCDPVRAIQRILAAPHSGFYVMKDLSPFMERPEVIRSLRDAYYTLRDRSRTHIAILSPELTIPPMLENELFVAEVPLPKGDELYQLLLNIQKEYPHVVLPERLHSAVTLALRGLTLNEATHVVRRVFESGSVEEKEIFRQIFAEKGTLVRKSGVLEFIAKPVNISNIGGLDILKEWAIKRRELFTQKAVDTGLPVPRGVLIMGISGCGKSLAAKAIASLWRVPLFRLDMNMVFSGIYGTPEAAFHRALRSIEAVAPAVLWIDEIENALGMTVTTTTAEQSLTFSSFLTWMQERPPLVFVAATANRIHSLPAEVIRKGRFDEVFFCDLPTETERREIIRIHLRLNGADPEVINPDRLLHSTRGWTGAEIEQAIIAARIDALHENRPMTLEDVRNHTLGMVPLSETMAEQIRAIRSWSHNRARRASIAPPPSMLPT